MYILYVAEKYIHIHLYCLMCIMQVQRSAQSECDQRVDAAFVCGLSRRVRQSIQKRHVTAQYCRL